jgi:hypothetical protein
MLTDTVNPLNQEKDDKITPSMKEKMSFIMFLKSLSPNLPLLNLIFAYNPTSQN